MTVDLQVIGEIVIAIFGSLTTITLGGLWFGKWVIASENKALKDDQAAELKVVKDIEDAKMLHAKQEKDAERKSIEAIEQAKRDADPIYIAAQEKRKQEEQAEKERLLNERLEQAKEATAKAQKFRSFKDALCPHCDVGMKWNNAPPPYCTCDKATVGHYHMCCTVARPDGVCVGCQGEWLMLAKNSEAP